MRLPLRIVLGLLIALFAVLGLGFLFDPVRAAGDMGLEAMNLAGMNALRGDLAGLFLALASMIVLGLVLRSATWFYATALLLGLIALGRLVGFVLDGVVAPALVALFVEIASIAMLIIAGRQLGVEPDTAPSEPPA